jgi:hypothetical protein
MPDTGDTKGPWGTAPPTLKSHAEALSVTFDGKGFVLLVFEPKGGGRALKLNCISNVRPAAAAAVMRAYAKTCGQSEDPPAGTPLN